MSRSDLLFMLAVVAIVDCLTLWGIFAGDYPLQATLFPGLAAGTLTLLALGRVGYALRGRLAMISETSEPDALHEPDEGETQVRADLVAALWILAALPLVYLLGYQLGLPLHALSYQIAHGVRATKAAMVSALIAVFIWLLFGQVLALQLPQGVVVERLAHG